MPYRIVFPVDAFDVPTAERLQTKALYRLLNTLVDLNLDWLAEYPDTPPLYRSGVRYQAEPPGAEDWDGLATCYARGWGDCEDLVAIRCAELNRAGIAARPLINRTKIPSGGTMFHIVCLWPKPWWQYGNSPPFQPARGLIKTGTDEDQIEDVSALLGM